MSVQTVAEFPVAVPETSAAPVRSASTAPKVSVQEYFALERASDIRLEYVEGEIIPMPGESRSHNRIALNFSILFDRAFERRDCEVYIESVRLRVSPTRYRYPDVVALCGDPVTDGENPPALLNPGVIVEVLSPSTQATDRGEKFLEYRQISGLTDYVLVAQEAMTVIHYVRQSARHWNVTEYTEPTDVLTFAFLSVGLTLAEIYEQVALPAPQPPAAIE